jgi:hypothetical protein
MMQPMTGGEMAGEGSLGGAHIGAAHQLVD